MNLSRLASALFIVATAIGGTVIACGGPDGQLPDAKVFLDAKVFMDAPPGVMGLGQKCTQPSECPSNAPQCIGISGGPQVAYCSPTCLMNATATGSANGTLQMISPALSTGNGACTGAYMGTVGTPVCGLILSYSPMHVPPMAGSNYTMVTAACAIVCGAGNTCPPGMTGTTFGTACLCLPM